MKGDFQVRFREKLRVRFPWFTRLRGVPSNGRVYLDWFLRKKCDFWPRFFSPSTDDIGELKVQIINVDITTDMNKVVRNDLYLENLFFAPQIPIETHNLLRYIYKTNSFCHHKEATKLKIAYMTAEKNLKKIETLFYSMSYYI